MVNPYEIDLHVHTSERSACANASEEKQIRAAINAGLGGIAITDHDRLVPRAHLEALNKQYAPFKIFTGIEVSVDDLHWVVIGLHEPALERSGWQYPGLLEFVRERGGFIFLAHPYRYRPQISVNLETHLPDGIEGESTNTPTHRKSDIHALAARLGLLVLTNSDAHQTNGLGRYKNALPVPAANDRELVEALLKLKNGGAHARG